MTGEESAQQDEFFESLLGDFLDESAQLLENLNHNLLELEEWVDSLDEGEISRCDDDLMNEMFRSAHSFKGLSAMLGLSDINHLTHNVENVFDAARQDQLQFDNNSVELIFQAVDHLERMVDCLKDPNQAAVDYQSTIDGMHELLQQAGVQKEQQTQSDAEGAFAMIESSQPNESTPPDAEADVSPCAEDVDLFSDVCDEADVPAKYLSIFIDESQLSLETLSNTLLALEGMTGGDTDENLLITAHRIKGSAATVGLNRPAKLAHYMEDILQELRETGDPLGVELADALLQCTDALHTYVDGLKSGNPQSETFNELSHELLRAQVINRSQQASTQLATAAPPQRATKPSKVATHVELTDQLREQIKETAPAGTVGYLGAIHFRDNFPLIGLKARLVYEKLSHAGEVFYCDPDAEVLEDLDELDGMSFGMITESEMASISSQLNIAGVDRIEIEPFCNVDATETADGSTQRAASTTAAMARSTSTPATSAKTASERKASVSATSPKERTGSTMGRTTDSNKPAETLRVDIDRLDQLMNLAGQLVINKARFFKIGEGLKYLLESKHTSRLIENASGLLQKVAADVGACKSNRQIAGNLEAIHSHVQRLQSDLEMVQEDVERFSQARAGIADLFEAVHQLDRVTDGIQKSVMDTRMVSIGPLFNRFKRVIRDITRDNGKTVKLVIHGEKTELDKRMIDELGDPLIHMVRNSADHGIELPGVREAAGKPRQGTVTLNAFHRGNSIVIQVTDDGKGLDVERIRDKAVARNIITAADAERMTNHQLFQLIWEPGFTTAEKVTEVSGRGMGMDIVRSKIEEINGHVELDSEPGVGTTFTIKLPLTLAILPCLMAKIDDEVFALPIESVREIVSIAPSDFSSIHQMRTARVRGRVVSVVCLREIFTWNRTAPRPTERKNGSEDTTLVIISDSNQELAVVVDELLGEEDIVIKSMAENYRHVIGVAGASILGDGRVSLILDIAALIEMSSNKAAELTVT